MDVYDFDGTLYQGDSTTDFLKWCMRRHPRIVLTLPRTALAAAACFGMHCTEKTRFKNTLYRFLPLIPDIESEVARFWNAHRERIAGPCNPKQGDLVISASPEFLLRDLCAERGLSLMASPVDPHTGRTLGPNCSGAEKVVRLRAVYPDEPVETFYSDSRSDNPLAEIAHAAFFVKDGRLVPWPQGR